MDWLNFVQNALFPPTCILCHNKGIVGKDICQLCLEQLPKNHDCCYQCGKNLAQQAQYKKRCMACIKKPPLYQRTYAPFLYQGAISSLITDLKFRHHYKNARLLGQLLADAVQQNPELPDCIIPVPLHKNRYRERGFNQSIEIAKIVAQRLNVSLELNGCIRHRDTPHQVGLSAQQREVNILDAFSVTKSFRHQHVAIVDDVMTKGATVNEIAKVLTHAGVMTIEVWVCARTDFLP